MELVKTTTDLIQNVLYLYTELESVIPEDSTYARDLIKRGDCFLKYTDQDASFFAPSRFIGYRENTLAGHKAGHPHGGYTTNVISRILGQEPISSNHLEEDYQLFCRQNEIIAAEKPHLRTFWNFESVITDVNQDFSAPEGREFYTRHIRRERNREVRDMAIRNFRQSNNGRIFCEGCQFSFTDVYGEDFIECHHTIPLAAMSPGHMTKPEDLVLLCANCHRIVHRKSQWLTITELREIVNHYRLQRGNG